MSVWVRASRAGTPFALLPKKMNNFFGGLHTLVPMAETIAESFKQFGNIAMEGKRVGTANATGVSVFGTDSGTVRLARTTCKALAKWPDEKSGAYRQWNTYLRNAGVSKTILADIPRQ